MYQMQTTDLGNQHQNGFGVLAAASLRRLQQTREPGANETQRGL